MERIHFEYEGSSFETVYINPDSRLTTSDRERLAWETFDMYKRGLRERNVKDENFEGRITFEGDISFFGMSGPDFKAEVETNRGRATVNYLIAIRVEWPTSPQNRENWN